MTFPDTEMMELCREHPTNIHNTRSLIRTLKYALDILQTEEDFMVKEYKHTHTHIHTGCVNWYLQIQRDTWNPAKHM